MTAGTLRNGIFLAPFHPLDEDPTEAIHRDLELVEHLDRLGYEEAWIGEHHSAGFEIIASPELFIAAAAERTQAHQARHRRRVAAVPPPAHGREPHHPARSHDARPRHVRRRSGTAAVGRLHARHPGREAARPHGRVARRDPAALQRRGRHRADRVVQPAERARASAALHQAAPRGLRRQHDHALGRPARRQVRPRHALRRGDHSRPATTSSAPTGRSPATSPPSAAPPWIAAALRLVGPVHIAETREQARRERRVRTPEVDRLLHDVQPRRGSATPFTAEDPAAALVESGQAVIGTPDDAIASSSGSASRAADFGCFLQLAHNWADWEQHAEVLRALGPPREPRISAAPRPTAKRRSSGRATTSASSWARR